MIWRKPKGARTDKLKCVPTGIWETPVVDMEYRSPQQHGGIYGTVYRQYHGAKNALDTISIPGITRLLDYCGRFDTDVVYHGHAHDAINYIWLDRGSDIVTFHINGWTHIDGWIEYTK